MHDDDPGDVLRDAYRHIPERVEPSPFLWRRTRAALRQQGLLRAPVWPRRGLIGAGVLAASLAGFALGLGVGRADHAPPPVSTAAALSDPLVAAQLVQETGTVHAIALETLVRSLQQSRPAGVAPGDVALGQQVMLAAARAQATALRRLVSPGLAAEVATTPASAQPVIWF